MLVKVQPHSSTKLPISVSTPWVGGRLRSAAGAVAISDGKRRVSFSSSAGKWIPAQGSVQGLRGMRAGASKAKVCCTRRREESKTSAP